jgi:hypothetical protein
MAIQAGRDMMNLGYEFNMANKSKIRIGLHNGLTMKNMFKYRTCIVFKYSLSMFEYHRD